MFEAIKTIKQECRRCFACVRDCPAKAIKIVEGQASVVAERCIVCGNCTIVCSQHAKTYAIGLERVEELLSSNRPVAALLAPSFPAEFVGQKAEQIVGALKEIGFRWVVEVAYGADLVSDAYREFLSKHPNGPWIASTCPAVNEYVRKYQPDLAALLIPIVSPMIATALAVREMYSQDAACIFIGPCIAKKLEIRDANCPEGVEEVLTFKELKSLFAQRMIMPTQMDPRPFDPPQASIGRAFPLSGGLVKSARLSSDLLDPGIISVSGSHEIIDLLNSAVRGEIKPHLIEALMCHGCHNGPGLTELNKRHQRKDAILTYVKESIKNREGIRQNIKRPAYQLKHANLSLKRGFVPEDHRLKDPTDEEIQAIMARTNKFTKADELNCRACGYDTCRKKAVAVYHGLAEDPMCLPFMIDQAERVCLELRMPWQDIGQVHRHLINTEKLASMGQLAAGVAHELNNPLGTILLYTNLLKRKLKERRDMDHDLNLLISEAERCKKIVGGLLDFARQNRVRMEQVSLSKLIDSVIDVYFSVSQLVGKGIEIIHEGGISDPVVVLDRDQITQVMVNLIKNAVEAMYGKSGKIRIKTEELNNKGTVCISVTDQGNGIPDEDREKIFQPFFTTKSIGKGVGLGLPICYGIVKMHRGNIWCESVIGKGTTFHIELPKAQALEERSNLS